MVQYIDKDALAAEIEKIIADETESIKTFEHSKNVSEVQRSNARLSVLEHIRSFLDTLEVKEVDLKKLGEIARHLIAVKKHIEDMRLNKAEWFMLEKIGYPERFKAVKGE